MSKIMNMFRIWAIVLLFSAISLATPVLAAESCVAADCNSLGYKQTLSECSGKEMIKCPFDLSKVNCNAGASTCGDRFYGTSTCPDNATCTSCVEGAKTFQKSISCNQDYAFNSVSWTCKDDRCPVGYKRSARDCGTSGTKGWTLSSYPQSSPAGNPCYACMANSCSSYDYPYTTCASSSCTACYPGDGTPRYKCGASQMYINSRCVYQVAKNGYWQWSGPSACCSYPTGKGYDDNCYSYLQNLSINQYPHSAAKLSCGSFVQSGNNIYYDYGN